MYVCHSNYNTVATISRISLLLNFSVKLHSVKNFLWCSLVSRHCDLTWKLFKIHFLGLFLRKSPLCYKKSQSLCFRYKVNSCVRFFVLTIANLDTFHNKYFIYIHQIILSSTLYLSMVWRKFYRKSVKMNLATFTYINSR